MREAAIYRLYVLPPDFTGGSYLPFDCGLVRVDSSIDVTMALGLGPPKVDAHGRAVHPAEPLNGPPVVRFDIFGILIDGRGARTGTHWRWRLEPLRPGVGDWKAIFDDQEATLVRAAEQPPAPIDSYFVDKRS